MGKAFLDDIADPSEEPAAVFRKRLTADAFGNSPACRTSTASRSPCSSWRTPASNGFHTWVIEHVGLTGVGDLVFNEGADHLIDAQGRKIGISIPLMSAFRISRRTDQRMARLLNPGGVRQHAPTRGLRVCEASFDLRSSPWFWRRLKGLRARVKFASWANFPSASFE